MSEAKHINEMTLRDFRALPQMDVEWSKHVRCDSIILLPTGKRHDSGYGMVAFVPCVKKQPLGILGGCTDDVEWKRGARAPNTDRIHMDCMARSRLLNVWGDCQFVIHARLSSTDIEIVRREP